MKLKPNDKARKWASRVLVQYGINHAIVDGEVTLRWDDLVRVLYALQASHLTIHGIVSAFKESLTGIDGHLESFHAFFPIVGEPVGAEELSEVAQSLIDEVGGPQAAEPEPEAPGPDEDAPRPQMPRMFVLDPSGCKN